MIRNLFLLYRKPVEHFLKTIDEITEKDITSIAQKLLSSPLTMASHGDGNLIGVHLLFAFCSFLLKMQVIMSLVSVTFAVLYVPSYDAVSGIFRSQ